MASWCLCPKCDKFSLFLDWEDIDNGSDYPICPLCKKDSYWIDIHAVKDEPWLMMEEKPLYKNLKRKFLLRNLA